MGGAGSSAAGGSAGCPVGGSTGSLLGESTVSTAAVLIPGVTLLCVIFGAARSLATVPIRSVLLTAPPPTEFICAAASFCGAAAASRSENDASETAWLDTERVVGVPAMERFGRTARASTPAPTHRPHTAATATVRIPTCITTLPTANQTDSDKGKLLPTHAADNTNAVRPPQPSAPVRTG
ncbi:Uncharacterised protein [Mycobacteroides abscessus]|nr:Uncharacterised protein [Mycobacteroides abscessus]